MTRALQSAGRRAREVQSAMRKYAEAELFAAFRSVSEGVIGTKDSLNAPCSPRLLFVNGDS